MKLMFASLLLLFIGCKSSKLQGTWQKTSCESNRSALFLYQTGKMKYCHETLPTRPGNRHLQPLR